MEKIHINRRTTLNGTIIDFETTHWDPDLGELITAGFLSDEGIVICQRLDLTEDEFKKRIVEEIQNKDRPWYAFNKKFEEKFLRISIDKELQQFKRESTFGALLNEGLLDHYNSLCDPCFNDEINLFWAAWKSTREKVFVSKIMRHNYCCLVKEYFLKQKRIDNLSITEIEQFPSSARIEKVNIRKSLNYLINKR